MSTTTARSCDKPALCNLSFEVLLNICSHLCLHCQRRPVMVDAGEHEVLSGYQGQKALANLALTSRRLRDIAQPVLFHYYHTGTKPSDGVFGSDTFGGSGTWGGKECQEHEAHVMQAYLRTLLQRPDLANCVKAFAFFAAEAIVMTDVPEGIDAQELFVEAGQNLGFKPLGSSLDVHPITWRDKKVTIDRLQEIAILNSPNVEQLLLHRNCGQEWWMRDDDRSQLPRLKYLAFPGIYHEFDECYVLGRMETLIRKAVNLEVLIAADCSINPRPQISGIDSETDVREFFADQLKKWNTALPNLRKLSFNSVRLDAVSLNIWPKCQQLEDVEYFGDLASFSGSWPDLFDSIRPNLRRLCLSTTNITLGADITGPPVINDLEQLSRLLVADSRAGLWNETGVPASFGGFTNLQILEIEQILLYGPNVFEHQDGDEISDKYTGPERFMASLPPTLRVLHLGLIISWRHLFRDLMGLAKEESRFPTLQLIVIDVYEAPPEDEAAALTESLSLAGVGFVIQDVEDVTLFLSRGMLGPRPGCPLGRLNKWWYINQEPRVIAGMQNPPFALDDGDSVHKLQSESKSLLESYFAAKKLERLTLS